MGVKMPNSFFGVTDLSTVLTNIAAIEAIVNLTGVSYQGKLIEANIAGFPGATIILSDVATNTFGAYVQIQAATAANSWLNSVTIVPEPSITSGYFKVQIGIGAAGSEVMIFSYSFHYYEATDAGHNQSLVLPTIREIYIPSGSRVAARLSANGAGPLSCRLSVQRRIL